MAHAKRAFVLGAGFSKPAKMPLAAELLPLLTQELEHDELRAWTDGLRERLDWLSGYGQRTRSLTRGLWAHCCSVWWRCCSRQPTRSRPLNIEEVFHYAHFDIEVERLRQHLARVGRYDGPATPWNQADSISSWLLDLENSLCDVILKCDDAADLAPITRCAEAVTARDTVVTFNYDTLIERALSDLGKPWNHATHPEREGEITVCKLHGSIDWIVADRCESFSNCDLLFEKENVNRSDRRTGHVEDDCRLWRCRTRDQLRKWISDRDLQLLPNGALPRRVGIAGLGAYKEPHQIPGLGRVWAEAMGALHDADIAIVVGFSMSDFDAMAQMQCGQVAQSRQNEGRPLVVKVINPCIDRDTKLRFRRVFSHVSFYEWCHETVDWSRF